MALTPAKENESNMDDSQEGITVAIRMRPLNNVEENKKTNLEGTAKVFIHRTDDTRWEASLGTHHRTHILHV
jgi:hypothetical protein